MTKEGNELLEKAKEMKAEMERSDQPWNKLANIQKNREKETITKLINAFWNADIGGILILSPKQNKELKNFIENECKKYPELKDFPKEFKQYPEICDCIYFHDNSRHLYDRSESNERIETDDNRRTKTNDKRRNRKIIHMKKPFINCHEC